MDEQVKPANFGRHAAERINWKSPAAIAKQYRLANRASVYRHAEAAGLYYSNCLVREGHVPEMENEPKDRTSPKDRTCYAKTKAGLQCRAPAVSGKQYCSLHKLTEAALLLFWLSCFTLPWWTTPSGFKSQRWLDTRVAFSSLYFVISVPRKDMTCDRGPFDRSSRIYWPSMQFSLPLCL